MDSNEVKLHFLDYWRVIRLRWGLIALVFLLVVVSAAVTVSLLPKEYFSKVTLEVKPDDTRAWNPNGGTGGFIYNASFVATQFQILRKNSILYPVIEQLDLIKIFSGAGPKRSKQEVSDMLARSLDIQEVRNTSLIEVGVWNTDANLAANVANFIARVYRDERLKDLQTNLDRSLSQYQDEVVKQRKSTLEAAQEMARLRVRDNINDPDSESSGSPVTSSNIGATQPQVAVAELQQKIREIETALSLMEKLNPAQLLNAMHTLGLEDPTISQNLPILQQAVVEEANLLSTGLAERHPKILGLRARKAKLNEILSDAVQGIRINQTMNLKFAKDKLTAADAWEKEKTGEVIRLKNNANEYINAKINYLQLRKIVENAEIALSKVRGERVVDTDPVIVRQRAEPALGPGRPAVARYVLLSAVVGLIVGVALAFFIEYLDTSVKTLDDLEKFLQLPVLAVIPRGIPVLVRVPGEHPDTEAYRIMRANIEFNKPRPDAKTLTVISAGPGEGKSTTLNNLAFTCAKGGYNVLVVDADLRRPAQHTFFDTDNSLGLVDFLQGKASVDAITRTTKIDNLSFIPSGKIPEENAGVLNANLINQLIKQVRGQYDLIVFDSPPILGVSDGSVLASVVDMVVIVVQHRRFPRNMLQRVKHSVAQVGGAVAGVVLNNVDTRHDEGYSYYNAYQDYYAPKRNERRPAPPVAAPLPARRPVAPPVAVPPSRHDDGADY